ncbi:hypothetical protein BFP76_06705 [Amylibacter kogurei]|uniref:histidine kinase n=1 Tax=Paramylibacter kogurei TaxID=1889778 RepID=A0A2G5K769_9RHOB|nr:PAS domain-containing sensor histidine kinase [Amylibacter kogurei]PIB24852.1 hypothetical protein BFP76_06705 [Amylibacter kogurei]
MKSKLLSENLIRRNSVNNWFTFNTSIILILGLCTVGLQLMLPRSLSFLIAMASVSTFGLVFFLTGQVGSDAIEALTKKRVLQRISPSKLFQRKRAAIPAHLLPKKINKFELLDNLPIALVTIDTAGETTRCNTAAKELLGCSENETPLFSELTQGLGRSVSQWLAAEQRNECASKPQILKVKRANNDVFVQVTLAKIGGNELLAVLSDATELKTLEAQFVQSQKMQAIGQLAGGVAHDFNNLLTAISGYCDLLKLRHDKGDASYNDLEQIGNNANRAAALVGQLLAFSRKQTLQPKKVQVNDILADLTHLLNRLVGETIKLHLEQDKSLPLAYVDGRQMEQVILNLVVNARDAMPKGGNIWVRSKSITYSQNHKRDKVDIVKGEYVCIEVEDEGVGISQENQSKIFEPFFSTKKVGEGTGLGLSTVYGIVKQTGGYIFVENGDHYGAKFTVLLPVAQPATVSEDLSAEKPVVHAKGLSGALALLVEDEDPVRAFATRALELQGVNVVAARSGEEAIELVKKHCDQIDVIISDVIMPGLNGPEWLRKARKDCAKAKVIFMSGYAEEVFEDKNNTTEDYDFLAKPFSLQALVEMVSKSLS